MKKLITITLLVLVAVTSYSQSNAVKTNYKFSKSVVVENEIGVVKDIQDIKEKEFDETEITITYNQLEKVMLFDLGFFEEQIIITEEKSNIIDLQRIYKLKEYDYEYLIMGKDYAIFKSEEDSRTLILITDQFKFK